MHSKELSRSSMTAIRYDEPAKIIDRQGMITIWGSMGMEESASICEYPLLSTFHCKIIFYQKYTDLLRRLKIKRKSIINAFRHRKSSYKKNSDRGPANRVMNICLVFE